MPVSGRIAETGKVCLVQLCHESLALFYNLKDGMLFTCILSSLLVLHTLRI
jgi:hypothetical protein